MCINMQCSVSSLDMVMTDNEDYSHYYLPLLVNQRASDNNGNIKRPALHTAFVEFCDLAEPDSDRSEIPREYHNLFKPLPIFLPRIQKKKISNQETPKPLISSSCPTLNCTKYKVPCTFTEGLSSLSKATTPIFSVQRRDVLAANLPQDIKLCHEKDKAYFSVESNISKHDTKANTLVLSLKNKALEKKGSIIPQKVKETNSRPMLHFAPDVLVGNSRLKPRFKQSTVKMPERPVTPYYLKSKRPKQLAVIPKVVCIGEYSDEVRQGKQKLKNTPDRSNFHGNDNGVIDKSTLHDENLIFRVPNANIELPFSILRDASTLKAKENHPHRGVQKKSNYEKQQLHLDVEKQNCKNEHTDDNQMKLFKFVVKMPAISGFASPESCSGHSCDQEMDFSRPKTQEHSNNIEHEANDQIEDRSTDSVRLISLDSPTTTNCHIIKLPSVHSMDCNHRESGCQSITLPKKDVEIIVNRDFIREVTTQIYSKI